MPQSILIIEDNPSFRDFLAMGLDDAGFRTLEAADAAEAMRIFLNQSPDLVLLDLGIGGENGMTMLGSMKKVRPGIPVIIVSGRTQINDAIEAFKAGAWDYVTKPIMSLEVFINGVRNCLAQTMLEQRVQNTQEHLFRLIQNLPVIIFIINRDLEFEFLNQTTEQILGYSPQEILQSPRPFLKCIHPADRKNFTDALKRGLGPDATEFRLEFRFQHKKGYQISLLAQSIGYPLAPGALPDRVEGMILDVTRTSYMDKILLQNEKLSLLRLMTEEVAHEIRNPLVSLGGFARQLRARFPEALETEVILEECGRLERLVQRIGAYLEPMHVALTSCLIPSTLAFAMRLLSSRLERKSVTCAIDMDDALPAVLADQELLHRIFIYLIAHGADIVDPAGNMRITTSQDAGLVHVHMSMEPVRPEYPAGSNRLIMPFEDEEMNLAMCFRLVERIGGHLHIERAGNAAVMTLSLPASSDAAQREETE
jgi:PAS domain S-box-containing protein